MRAGYNARMLKNKKTLVLLALIGLPVLAILLYNIPFVHERLSWRIDSLRMRIVYAMNPPDEVVFVPTQPVQDILTPTPSPAPTITPTLVGPTHTPVPTFTPTVTPTPLPGFVSLPGVKYVDQHNRWNYCGPANMAMALNFWGWKGDRDDVARVVKPGFNDLSVGFIERGKLDKNVMPYEMVNFVNEQTDFRALQRYGGDTGLVKRLIAAGFPVMIEKGYYERDYTGKVSWLGHYLFVTGYDESQGAFIVQDAYLQPGKNLLSKYEVFIEGWRGFNYLFIVVYPPDRESEVLTLLGDWADTDWANRNALAIADAEIETLEGNDLFFAWFNKGTSHVQLQQYDLAGPAYDTAFRIYNDLGSDDKQRPYRIMWYQTGPYFAYFYTGRYQDVINLANTTFKTIDKPTLEESLYWRGMAAYAIGDYQSAFADMRESVYLNPNFAPGLARMSEWGLTP